MDCKTIELLPAPPRYLPGWTRRRLWIEIGECLPIGPYATPALPRRQIQRAEHRREGGHMAGRVMLIGLCGPARSGKSTLASHLVRSHGFVEVALADPIKDALAAMFRVDLAEIERDKTAASPAGPSWRALMQSLGTDWGRELHADVWIEIAMQRVAEVMNAGRSVVVSDVRFSNEAIQITASGGHIIRVSREASPGAGGIEGHQSEAGLSDGIASWHVRNDGSIDDACAQMDAVLSLLLDTAAEARDEAFRRGAVES